MKEHFSRFLSSDPQRLHVAAHSHHPWPDVSFEAHRQAWLDAARMHDAKWDHVFGQVVPEFQGHVAGRLGLPDPSSIAFAPNTHEFVVRLLSCLRTPTRILTSDGEFHSFDRQVRRLEEDGAVRVRRVPTEPLTSFAERFRDAAADGGHDLVFISQVLFDSGFAVDDPSVIVRAVPETEAFVVLDGYHAFMARPTDLSTVADRAFYIAGGYKYAMAGEGAAFMHCPPGYGDRPPDTGWFAGFGSLPRSVGGEVAYPEGGSRFLGATFDPSGLYRFNAVQRWLDEIDVDEAQIHTHVRALHGRFLDSLGGVGGAAVTPEALVPGRSVRTRGNFLTFELDDAASVQSRLADIGVVTDHRGNRLRIGFGIYHDEADVDELLRRIAAIAEGPDRG